jgi:hypothetical protein
MTDFWRDIEPALRGQAYGSIDADPQILLEGDGGPSGLDADIFMARLIGYDDQIIEDTIIPHIVDQLLRATRTVNPLPLDGTSHDAIWCVDDVRAEPMTLREAYVLQSGYATATWSLECGPMPDVKPRPDGTIRIAYLRYRRRA